MVDRNDLIAIVNRTGAGPAPEITVIQRRGGSAKRLGVFSSSFNPLTAAHIEVMRKAVRTAGLDEVMALAGKTNADKTAYECSLENRVQMLLAGLSRWPDTSVGLSSSAFFVDKIDALAREYPADTEFFFIVGFDTFERVLDAEDRYTALYHRRFAGREDALRRLLSQSYLIVAGRSDKGVREVRNLAEGAAGDMHGRIRYLDLAPEFRDQSASEVRRRIRAGETITGLVPEEVESYIHEHGLYESERVREEG